MDDQNRNLILATALSFLVILVWFILFPPEEPVQDPNAVAVTAPATQDGVAPTPQSAEVRPAQSAPIETQSDALAEAARVDVVTPELTGSISLLGGRIDDLSLNSYREELDPESANVTMLSPVGTPNAYYTLYGWAPGGDLSGDAVPGASTLWQVESGDSLTPDSPITLVWDNGAGLVFRRTISVDERYLFTIDQTVENQSDAEVRLAPYGIVARHGQPNLVGFFILHEGVVQYIDDELNEIDYSDLPDLPVVQREGAKAEVTEVDGVVDRLR